MKKILLSILLLSSVIYAEPTGVEQKINEIDIQIKKLMDERKILEAQLVSPEAEKLVSKKEIPKEDKKTEKLNEEEIGFTTHAEIGYIKTSGNTDTETLNLDVKIKKEWEKHILAYSILILYGEENSKETKNKLFTDMNYYYKFTDRFAFDYLAAYKEDKFSGFNNQFYTGPGAVYKLINEEKHSLITKGNILYSRDDIEDTRVDSSGNKVSYPYPSGSIRNDDGYIDNYMAYKLRALYEWQITGDFKFSEDFNYRSQFDEAKNYFIYSKTSLAAKINDTFSAGISYQVDYINEAADGKERTDKTTMFNLIIDY